VRAPDLNLLRSVVHRLAEIERPSASDGERRAAEWIAAALSDRGLRAEAQEERAHGGYWWPLGLLSAAAAAAGLAGLGGRRALASLTGGAAAAAVWDDISGGRLWFRRRVLPARATWNVVAEAGDPAAARTVVLVAHHDAARSGLIFHPGVPAFFGERFPELLERTDTTPPVMFPVVAGPALVGLGGLLGSRAALRAGTIVSLGAAAVFADVGARGVVPGANDNLSGVATLVGVAEALAAEPVAGVRVLLVSTGSEESFMEGMQAFARRHFPRLATDRTHVVCVDTVGSPELVLLEGEGMTVMRDYPEDFKALVARCAADAGIHLRRGLRFRNATDGLIALRAGYPTVMLGSINRYKAPANYHWPTDTPERVDYETVGDAVVVCDAVIRRLAATAT